MDLPAWTCAASMLPMLDGLSRRYADKPVWVTEFACPKWIGPVFTKAGLPQQHCTESHHVALLAQLLPKLDAAPFVHRYAWDLNRAPGRVWSAGPGSTVVLASNNSLLGPWDFPGYPSSLSTLDRAFESCG